MGLVYNNLLMMARASSRDISFESVATVGKQSLNLHKVELESLSREFEIDVRDLTQKGDSEAMLGRLLGAKSISSIDVSDFEGCDYIHNMNYPIPADMHGKFDVLIDGGCIEHIYNVPVALDNYMKLVRPGGSVFIFTVANNHMGHGFYQFSPELFYRVLDIENQFSVRDMWLEVHPYPSIELSVKNLCYRVVDPKSVSARIGSVSKRLVYILVHGVKKEVADEQDGKEIFMPIQSDYMARHNQAGEPDVETATRASSIAGLLKQILPSPIANVIRGKRQLNVFSFSNKRYFEKI